MRHRLAALALLLFSIGWLSFFSMPAPVYPVSPAEALVEATGPVLLTFRLPATSASSGHVPATDNQGSASYSFQPSGQVVVMDSSGYSLTISQPFFGSPLVNRTVIAQGLSYNSSMAIYTFSATLGPTTISLSTIYTHLPGTLDMTVRITGSLTLPALLGFSFAGQGPHRTTGNSTWWGMLGYDWSDTHALHPVYTNATNRLYWPLSGGFNLDPVIVDANSIVATTTQGSSNSVTLTTSNPNDLILLWTDLNGVNVISSVTDTAGLSWKQRLSSGFITSVGYSYEYYALSPSILSSDVVTVTASGAENQGVSIVVIALSGTKLAAPFDPGGNSPASYNINAASAAYPNGTVTNTVTNTMVISFLSEWVNGGAGTPSPNNPLTLISKAQAGFINFENIGAAYALPSTLGPGIYSWSSGGASAYWEMGLDVVQSTSSSPPGGPGGCGLFLTGVCNPSPFQFKTTTICPAAAIPFLSTLIGCYNLPVQLLNPNLPLVAAGFTGLIFLSTVSRPERETRTRWEFKTLKPARHRLPRLRRKKNDRRKSLV